jgi:hypothetical protein
MPPRRALLYLSNRRNGFIIDKRFSLVQIIESITYWTINSEPYCPIHLIATNINRNESLENTTATVSFVPRSNMLHTNGNQRTILSKSVTNNHNTNRRQSNAIGRRRRDDALSLLISPLPLLLVDVGGGGAPNNRVINRTTCARVSERERTGYNVRYQTRHATRVK